jgi:hypothetical protein
MVHLSSSATAQLSWLSPQLGVLSACLLLCAMGVQAQPRPRGDPAGSARPARRQFRARPHTPSPYNEKARSLEWTQRPCGLCADPRKPRWPAPCSRNRRGAGRPLLVSRDPLGRAVPTGRAQLSRQGSSSTNCLPPHHPLLGKGAPRRSAKRKPAKPCGLSRFARSHQSGHWEQRLSGSISSCAPLAYAGRCNCQAPRRNSHIPFKQLVARRIPTAGSAATPASLTAPSVLV